MKRVDKFSHLQILSGILFAVGLLCLLYRIKFGIDFTDETWYCAEPYLIAKGAIPYVDNWSQAPGFTFPMFLIYKIFLFFNNGTEGIILFSRGLYVLWSCLILIIVWKLFNKKLVICRYAL
ncbi:MAG: hypothetical protein PHX08_06360 [Lachnospiraceae bacterium]|nr:hypothetical protein [Lachnospiraceae bacterium]